MTENVFNPGDTTKTQQDTNVNYLEQLVGEGKKFKSPEELAKGKAEADAYIETLVRKQDELRAELEKRMTAEEIANQLQSRLQQNQGSSQQAPQGQGEPGDGQNKTETKGLSQEDIRKLLDEQWSQNKAKEAAEKNISEVSKVLNEKIGATAPKYVEDKARELGMSVKELEQHAARSPKAFFKLIDLDTNPTQNRTFSPPTSSVSVQSTTNGAVRNKAYYDKLYKENPKLRFDKNTTIQEHKDALALGDQWLN